MNNKFSTKNSLLYKMKCINSRNNEYYELENKEINKIEKYTDKTKKWKMFSLFFIYLL